MSRLTDEELENAIERALPWIVTARMEPVERDTAINEEHLALDLFGDAFAELRERRAQDLTAQDVEALRWLSEWSKLPDCIPRSLTNREKHQAALAVLDKLLAREVGR